MHFYKNYLTGSINGRVLLYEKIKTFFQRGSGKLKDVWQHAIFKVVVVLIDKVGVLLIWLKTPESQL
jgi:hypothetical protein